ncbi:MAG: hypothetical protein HY241_14950 [Actinobacteria bacterium]|nr:hypothetical protein [Actinomycetota bacterium]
MTLVATLLLEARIVTDVGPTALKAFGGMALAGALVAMVAMWLPATNAFARTTKLARSAAGWR